MTVKGVQADEFLNVYERRSWIHDATDWKERPFTDRLVVAKQARFTVAFATNENPWVAVPQTGINFRKASDTTRIYVEGFITGFPSGLRRDGTDLTDLGTSVWYAPYVRGHDVMQKGNPPGDSKDAIGFLWHRHRRHKSCELAGFVRDSHTIPAGDHVMELQMGTLRGWVHFNGDDYWALRVWEVGY